MILRRILPFLMIMSDSEIDRSPDYVIEKFKRIMTDPDCFRMLDGKNKKRLLAYLQKWRVPMTEVFTAAEVSEIVENEAWAKIMVEDDSNQNAGGS